MQEKTFIMATLSDFQINTLQGNEANLAQYAGKVVLVVNTASKCGLAPQLDGLEKLYKDYSDRGLVVLGVPSDSFAQELGTSEEIAEVCERNYGVTFPMMEKVAVNGSTTHPLFSWLKREKSGFLGGAIKWNFTKFLIGRDGGVLERFAPTAAPDDLRPSIERALAA